MIKIFITVRNRLAVTKKCLLAIKKHSTMENQIFVYDNLTNYKLDEHFEFFYNMYRKNIIQQITFNSKQSTFNAFSKAVSINQFGQLHNMDPNKNNYDFLFMIDNDIILAPGWDIAIKEAWDEVKKRKMKNILVISQLPGGIKSKQVLDGKFGKFSAKMGKLGGGAIQSVQPDYFEKAGFLPIDRLVGHNKKSDQIYWTLMDKFTKGQPYILGLDTKLGFHVGSVAGSICNVCTRLKNKKEALEKIKYKEAEKKIEEMTFDEFYNSIKNNPEVINGW